jgi:predicted AlkP superfamily phosphohydrolase/phosphomutase
MTGAPLVRRIFRRDEIYEGPQVGQAPDLFLSWWEEEGFETRTSRLEDRGKAVVAEASATTADRAEWSGSHRLDGILAIRGAGIRRVARLPRARIIDLAPTILYMLGEAVPDDMDGRVLTEIFEPDRLARHPVVSCTSRSSDPREDAPTYSAEESEVIEGRLRDLGYLE